MTDQAERQATSEFAEQETQTPPEQLSLSPAEPLIPTPLEQFDISPWVNMGKSFSFTNPSLFMLLSLTLVNLWVHLVKRRKKGST